MKIEMKCHYFEITLYTINNDLFSNKKKKIISFYINLYIFNTSHQFFNCYNCFQIEAI